MLRELAARAVEAALGEGARSAGPVHLNAPYREPLAGDLPDWLDVPSAELASGGEPDPDAAPVNEEQAEVEPSGALYQGGGGIGGSDFAPAAEEAPFVLERGPRTVVVAGSDAGPDAEALAHAGGWPPRRRGGQRRTVRSQPRALLP